MEVKNRIIAVSDSLFFKLGIRSVTMDDIAKELGISKKTIYQFFDDKDAIVVSVFQQHMDKEVLALQEVMQNSSDVIEEFFKGIERMNLEMKNINPSAIHDVKKYHPKAWGIFQNFRDSIFLDSIKNNLKRGIEQGYYRPEIDIEVLSRLHMAGFEIATDSAFFPYSKFNPIAVHLEIFSHFLFGILNQAGLLKYHQHKINFQNA